jgi:ferredoxin
LDLGKTRYWRPFIDKIRSAAEADGACLFVGSPVYVFHAVPPVLRFIESLPSVPAGVAVPFVTWGCVTSGVALWEMGKMLIEKGFGLAAAAKVLSVHSRLWQSQHPIGEGHPDKADDAVVIGLIRSVFNNLVAGNTQSLSLGELDYQPHEHRGRMMRTSIKTDPRKIPPRKVLKDKCTRCADCQLGCPADAIELSPYPVFGEACFGCFNCVRLCPEKAIETDLSGRKAGLLKSRLTYNEAPVSRAFSPSILE